MATYDLGNVVGKGISSITKTSTQGLVDTYTITYTDNTTSTFTVTNGSVTSHTHNYSDINNVSIVNLQINYTDSTSETIKLLKYTGS